MKQFRMPDRKDPPDKKMSKPPGPTDAFDKWLTRGLHELFDGVMKEPVPPELLKLLKLDKKESDIDKKEDDPKK